MIDSKLPLEEKRSSLAEYVRRAREKVETAGPVKSDSRTSLEQQLLEGEQGPNEKAYDELKSVLESLTEAVQKLDTRAKEIENNRQQQLIDLRQLYADKAYKVAKYGLYWWATVILLSVVGKMFDKVIISDNALIAITTASTLNLFAAFLGVIRGLFPSTNHSSQEEK